MPPNFQPQRRRPRPTRSSWPISSRSTARPCNRPTKSGRRSKKALLQDLSKSEKIALQEQLIDAQRHYANLKSLYNENKRDAEAAEKQVTSMVKQESAARATSVKGSFLEIGAAAKNLGFQIAAAFGIVSIVQQAIGAIKQAITGYGDLGHEVEHIAQLMGTTTEKASLLDYTFKQFGMTGANVTQLLSQLTRHVVANEAEVNALGVATRDANGHLRSTYDIFDSMRQVMSNAADGTAKTADMLKLLARSGSAGGVALGELAQILGLTDEQMAAMERQARANNAILDKNQALMGTDMVQAGRELGQAFEGLGRTIGAVTVGPLTWFLNGLDDIIMSIETLVGMSGNLGDKIGAFFGAGPLAGTLRAQINQAQADRKALADLSQGHQGTDQLPTFAGGGGGGNPAVQALQDQLAAIRELATERENDLRDQLQGISRSHQAAIDAIQDEQGTRKVAHDKAIQDIRDETAALEGPIHPSRAVPLRRNHRPARAGCTPRPAVRDRASTGPAREGPAGPSDGPVRGPGHDPPRRAP